MSVSVQARSGAQLTALVCRERGKCFVSWPKKFRPGFVSYSSRSRVGSLAYAQYPEANINGRPFLYRNDGGNKNNWLMMSLTGRSSNCDAIGTRVVLTVKGTRLIRQMMSSSGYLSQSDKRLHFGLGPHTVVETIDIFWPNGKISKLNNVKTNQVLTVSEPL